MKKRWVMTVAALGALGWAAHGWFGSDDEVTVDHRIWIERMPETQRDIVGHWVLIERGGRRFGIDGRASSWRQESEVFFWALEEDRLTQVFPQTETRRKATVRAYTCEAPEPFELCLDIDTSDGSKRYYSRHEWVIEPDAAQAHLEGGPSLRIELPVDVPNQDI